MKKCAYCNNAIIEAESFCCFCGAFLKEESRFSLLCSLISNVRCLHAEHLVRSVCFGQKFCTRCGQDLETQVDSWSKGASLAGNIYHPS